MPRMQRSRSTTFRNVQVLRGVAALMVVAHHASQNWSANAFGNTGETWLNGAAGVDIFFVISGFVMAISSLGKGEGWAAARAFLERRLVRVMPLYWLITGLLMLKIGLGLVRNADGMHPIPFWFGLDSLLLIPCRNASGQILPLLSPGWTLSFEMFFYVWFALALGLRKSVPGLLTIALGALAVVGIFRAESWPTVTVLCSPLLLEFLAGLWLGHCARTGRVLEARWAAPLGAVGLVAIWLLPPATGSWMRLAWGLCGFLAVQAAIALEGSLGGRMPRWALLIGDASYSIYLTHSPLLGLWVFLLKKLHWMTPGDELRTLLFCTVLSTLAGIFVYKLVESPMNRGFRHLLRLRQPVQTESAAEAG